jgi:hypothetical protein
MHGLGIGRAHATTRVLILATADTVTVTDRATGEVLSEHTINPEKRYWPERWPSGAGALGVRREQCLNSSHRWARNRDVPGHRRHVNPQIWGSRVFISRLDNPFQGR